MVEDEISAVTTMRLDTIPIHPVERMTAMKEVRRLAAADGEVKPITRSSCRGEKAIAPWCNPWDVDGLFIWEWEPGGDAEAVPFDEGDSEDESLEEKESVTKKEERKTKNDAAGAKESVKDKRRKLGVKENGRNKKCEMKKKITRREKKRTKMKTEKRKKSRKKIKKRTKMKTKKEVKKKKM